MSSVFTKIIEREIPGYIVVETSDCCAFLDVNPLAKGHTLVVPKKEVDRLWDLDDETYQALTLLSKQIAQGIEKVIPCERVGVAVLGLEVPHAHIHLVPINNEGDLNFANPRVDLADAEMRAVANEIASALS